METEKTNIPPNSLSCQGMNESFSLPCFLDCCSLNHVLYRLVHCFCRTGFGFCFLVLSLSVDNVFHKPQLEQAPFFLVYFISFIHILLSDIFKCSLSNTFLCHFLPTLFSPKCCVWAGTQLEHISACISSDYWPYIQTLTQSCDTAPQCVLPQTEWKQMWCNVVLLRHTCD